MSILTRQARENASPDRGVLLLTSTAAITLVVTGVGLLEGHVVYPSWRDLATFGGFASYHREYGRSLLPWLPFPLLVAAGLNAWLVLRRPASVPRWLPIATLVGHGVVVVVTVTLALPLQADLGTNGRTPAEVVDLVDRLIAISYLRDIPGVAIAGAYVVMLHRAIGGARR